MFFSDIDRQSGRRRIKNYSRNYLTYWIFLTKYHLSNSVTNPFILPYFVARNHSRISQILTDFMVIFDYYLFVDTRNPFCTYLSIICQFCDTENSLLNHHFSIQKWLQVYYLMWKKSVSYSHEKSLLPRIK